MPVDYIALWGLTAAAGFVFRPILEHLALKTAEDFAKDFVKGCFKSVFKPSDVDILTVATGLAIKSFLQIIQDELEGAGYREDQLVALIEPLELFIKDEEVKSVLGPALVRHQESLDSSRLARAWKDLHMPDLPEDFSLNRVLNRYQKSVTAIRRDTPGLREIFETQLLESISSDIRSLSPIAPDADIERYQTAMRRAYGYLKLETLDATTYDLQRLRLDRLFIPQNVRECNEFLPQIFELPKEFQKRFQLLDYLEGKEYDQREIERYRKAYLKKSPRSVTDLFGKDHYRLFVVLGDPGSGKSSLLQWQVLSWAEQPVFKAELSRMPILIELDEYARNRREGTAKDFLEFLHNGTGVPCRLDRQKIRERLLAGQTAFLLDGLDEVFDVDLRREIVTDITRFANDYPRAQFVVTSRVIGYKAQSLRDAGFEHFMLQDLDAKQIRDFLARWHRAAYPDQTEGEAKRVSLETALKESRAIAELAGNPLLLTMMAILNRTQDLPRDRAELYNQCSRLLLYQWKADDALRSDVRFKGLSLDFKDKQAMLRRVAREMQSSEVGLAGNLIEEKPLENALASVIDGIGISQPSQLARAVVDHLRTRNFILCFVGGAFYSFVHRTFLEYFCALDFLWQFKEERSLDVDGLKTSVFGAHCEDEKWHEVLCLISGMLVPRIAGDIIDFLLGQAKSPDNDGTIVLAARCYGEIRNKAEVAALRNPLRACLQDVVERIPPPKKDIVASLGLEGKAIYDQSNVAVIGKARAESASRVRQRRAQALKCLGVYWNDDPGVYAWLIDLSKRRVEPALRETVFRELTDSWGDKPETFLFFAELAVTGDRGILRLAALSHLARRWPDDPRTRELIAKIVKSDSDASVRVRAIEGLTTVLGLNAESLATIQDVLEEELRSQQPTPVRKTCFEQLLRFRGIDNRSYALAKKGASTNSGSKTKKKIIQLLLRRTDNPEVPHLLLEIHSLALSRKLRNAVERQLKEKWGHLPEVMSLNDVPKSHDQK